MSSAIVSSESFSVSPLPPSLATSANFQWFFTQEISVDRCSPNVSWKVLILTIYSIYHTAIRHHFGSKYRRKCVCQVKLFSAHLIQLMRRRKVCKWHPQATLFQPTFHRRHLPKKFKLPKIYLSHYDKYIMNFNYIGTHFSGFSVNSIRARIVCPAQVQWRRWIQCCSHSCA